MRPQIRFSSFGIGVDLDLPDHPWLSDALPWVLPPHRTELTKDVADVRVHVLPVTDGWQLRNMTAGTSQVVASITSLAEVLEKEIRHHIALHAPGLVFIHAGVVEVDGAAVVIPGWSTSGKTTLVRAFLRAGCGYLSDEYAVIDRQGLIHPYARALSVRQPDGSRRHIPSAELGGADVSLPLQARAVIKLPRRTDVPAMLAREPAHEATMTLVSNAIAARSRSREVLTAAAGLARHCPYFRGFRGEADEAVDRVLELLRRPG